MDEDFIDTSNLSDDDQIDLAYSTLETLCNELSSRGLDPAILDAALFILWAQRMYEADAREDFERTLEEALEEPWPEGPTLH